MDAGIQTKKIIVISGICGTPNIKKNLLPIKEITNDNSISMSVKTKLLVQWNGNKFTKGVS